MKILLLSEFFLSGQTTHVLELAKQFAKNDHLVHIRFSRVHSSLFASYYAPQLENWGVSFSTGWSLESLMRLGSRFRPDLIHVHSSTLFSQANRVASRLGIPYIVTCHGLGFSHPKYHKDIKAAAYVITVGKNVAQEVAPLAQHIAVIPNGVDVDYFVPPVEKRGRRNKVFYVGRIDRWKIPGIVHLAETLEHSFLSRLTIVGDVDPNVGGTRFVKWQPDLLPTLQGSGIVASSGRTAREAMACGNVVLLMQKGYDGVVSPTLVAKDDFDFSGNLARYGFRRLKKDLEKLFKFSSRLRKLQKWSRKYAEENLSSKDMAKAVLSVYDYVCETHRPRRTRVDVQNWWLID